MDAYDFAHIPDLNEEEKKSPYARFYYEPIIPPATNVVAALQPGKEMNPSLALLPQNIGKLFVPGSLKVDTGYCVLPDGTGFSVVHTKGPDITLEMEQWWGTWFKLSEHSYVNYKIWMPSLHFTHGMPIWEDLGWGPIKIYITKPVTYDTLNLPAPPKKLNSKFLSLSGGVFTIVPDAPDESTYFATLVHYVTHGDDGLNVITCVWSGVHILDGTAVRMIGKKERIPLEYVRLFACHNAWEFARKMQLLPRLHALSKTL